MHLNIQLNQFETRTQLYCTQCKQLFQYRFDFECHLFQHIRSTNSINQRQQLYCPVCVQSGSFCFNRLNQFDKHVNEYHTGFNCGLCEYGTGLPDGQSIKQHLTSTHLNELIEYNEHNVTRSKHQQRAPLVSATLVEVENVYCSVCDKYFASSTCLAVHLNRFHAVKVVTATGPDEIDKSSSFQKKIKLENIY